MATPADLRQRARDTGCEKALEEAIGIIETLEGQLQSQADVVAQLDGEIAVLTATNQQLTETNAELVGEVLVLLKSMQPPPAVRLAVRVSGGPPPMGNVNISIDDTTGTVSVAWEDDHGDMDASAPLGNDGNPVVVAFTVDNTGVATVDPTSGKLSPVAEGAANADVTVTNATDGQPAVWASGPSAGQPITGTAAPFTVVAGAADALAVNVAP